MKRLILIAVLVFTIIRTASGMLPGPPLLVECPKCGEEKKLMTLISGNTIGALQWSDTYQWAPMLPRLSPVQKCKGCGAYFLLSQAKEHRSTEDEYSSDTGRLTFGEMKEALCLLDDESLTKEDKLNIRLEFLHRYNDAFREYEYEIREVDAKRSDEDVRLHKENLVEIIALLDATDNARIPVIAEMYREAGDFEECLSLLEAYTPDADFMNHIVGMIKAKAKEKDDKVFLITLQ